MVVKDYCGKCGTCRYCELGTANTDWFSTTFQCSRNGYSVKADEKVCNKFEPALGRTNEDVARYDK